MNSKELKPELEGRGRISDVVLGEPAVHRGKVLYLDRKRILETEL